MRGRHCYEFLMVRAFCTVDDPFGNAITRTIFSEPIQLPSKHTWITYGAIAAFVPFPRELGHQGIIIFASCLDGGLHSSLSRRLNQHSDSWYVEQGMSKEIVRLKNREWRVQNLCGIHVGHNADKWSCFIHLLNTKQDTKQFFGCASAVRDSFLVLVAYFRIFCNAWQYHDHNDLEIDVNAGGDIEVHVDIRVSALV